MAFLKLPRAKDITPEQFERIARSGNMRFSPSNISRFFGSEAGGSGGRDLGEIQLVLDTVSRNLERDLSRSREDLERLGADPAVRKNREGDIRRIVADIPEEFRTPEAGQLVGEVEKGFGETPAQREAKRVELLRTAEPVSERQLTPPPQGRLLGPSEFERLRTQLKVGPANFDQFFSKDAQGNIFLKPTAPADSSEFEDYPRPLIVPRPPNLPPFPQEGERLLGPSEFEKIRTERQIGPAGFEQTFRRDEQGNIFLRPETQAPAQPAPPPPVLDLRRPPAPQGGVRLTEQEGGRPLRVSTPPAGQLAPPAGQVPVSGGGSIQAPVLSPVDTTINFLNQLRALTPTAAAPELQKTLETSQSRQLEQQAGLVQGVREREGQADIVRRLQEEQGLPDLTQQLQRLGTAQAGVERRLEKIPEEQKQVASEFFVNASQLDRLTAAEAKPIRDLLAEINRARQLGLDEFNLKRDLVRELSIAEAEDADREIKALQLELGFTSDETDRLRRDIGEALERKNQERQLTLQEAGVGLQFQQEQRLGRGQERELTLAEQQERRLATGQEREFTLAEQQERRLGEQAELNRQLSVLGALTDLPVGQKVNIGGVEYEGLKSEQKNTRQIQTEDGSGRVRVHTINADTGELIKTTELGAVGTPSRVGGGGGGGGGRGISDTGGKPSSFDLAKDFVSSQPDASDAELKQALFEAISKKELDLSVTEVNSIVNAREKPEKEIATRESIKNKVVEVLNPQKHLFSRKEAKESAELQLKKSLKLNKDQELPKSFIEAIEDALVEVYGRTFGQRIFPGGR